MTNLPSAFDDLVDRPRWLAWREEERDGRKTKVPYAVAGRGLGSATDPATWGTHNQAEDRARLLDDGRKVGCGTVLGDIGDRLFLAGADLDAALDETGALAPWAAEIVSALGTYTEISPSGQGLKSFFYIGGGDVRWFLDLIGVPIQGWGTKRGIPGLSGADHGPGIEIYGSHRYFTVTGAIWAADHPLIVLLERTQLEVLAAAIPPAKKAGKGHAGGDHDTSRSAKAFRAALATAVGSFEEMCEALRRHPDPEIQDWVREKGEANDSRELHRIWDRIRDGEGVRLGDFYAYMPMHKYMFAPARELWPLISVNARVPPVPLFDRDGTPLLDLKGQQVKIPAAAWLDKHKPVEQMTWAPGMPMIIENRLILEGGWIERNGVSCFNLYRPPTLIPGDARQATRWLDHVEKVYPDDAAHIIKWLAHRVQHAEDKINHALVLGGAQGIGKDTLLEPAKRAVGPWNVSEPSPQQLLGRFNGFVKSVIMRVNETSDLGDIDRYAFYEHMKVYCAAPPDVLRVDEKHLHEYHVINVCGVVLTTNHKTDGIYLPADDRRHYVAWSHLTKEIFEEPYWSSLWGWYDNGGDRHVAAYLAELDLSGFNPKAPPPKTEAFWNIVNADQAPELAEIQDVLERIGNPDAVTLESLSRASGNADYEAGGDVVGEFTAWLRDRKNRRIIPHRIESLGYVPVNNPDAKDGLWKIEGHRQRVYAKASLSRDEQIRAARGLV